MSQAPVSKPTPLPNKQIDLLPLLENPALNSAMLFHIRSINNRVEGIIWQAFKRTHNKKRAKKRKTPRHQFIKLLANSDLEGGIKKWATDYTNAKKGDAIKPRSRIDFLAASAIEFLAKLPPNLATKIDEEMTHLIIPYKLKDLVNVLKQIQQVRNLLEHWQQKNPQKRKKAMEKCNQQVLFTSFCILIPPDLVGDLIGKANSQHPQMSEVLRTHFNHQRDQTKQQTKHYFASFRTKKNLAKQKRKMLVDKTLPWRRAYEISSKKQGEYRQQNFLVRYNFVGQENFNKIKSELYKTTTPQVSFKYAIYPVFVLNMKMAVVISQFISEGKIRNSLAHNKMLWDMRDPEGNKLTLKAIFYQVAKQCPESLRHNCYQKFKALIQKQQQTYTELCCKGNIHQYKITHSPHRSDFRIVRKWIMHLRRDLDSAFRTYGIAKPKPDKRSRKFDTS